MNQREKTRILKLYNQISFPGSFSSTKKFRHSLRENANIEISERALKSILEDDLFHKMTRVRPKNPIQRPIVLNSVVVSAQVDTAFIQLRVPRTLAQRKQRYPFQKSEDVIINHNFILILDILSRFCYAKPIPKEVNKDTLKTALNKLFEEGMPKFNILKCDADPSLLKLKGFLANKSVFLFVKRHSAPLSFSTPTKKSMDFFTFIMHICIKK